MAEFNINAPREGATKSAMLPTVGTTSTMLGPLAFKVNNVDDYLLAIHSAIGDAATKAMDGLSEAAKALGATPPQALSYSSMSFLPDPANYGLMQWPGFNPESLRKIARENVAPMVIIRNRIDDLTRYSNLSTYPWKPGWRIAMRDPKEQPARQDEKDIEEAQKFIYNCSMDGDLDPRDRDAHLIPPFEMFIRSFGDDALTFDGWAIWTDMESKNKVRAFANLPAGMMRLAVPTRGYKGDPSLFAALVDETGTPVKPFTRQELVWRIRNIRNDPSIGPYGWPEIEMAIRLIQAFQGAIELNADTFQRNSIPNGVLVLKGDYFNQEQIDALTREWTNMKRGMSKLWGMPVISVPEDGEVDILNFMDLKGQEVRYRDHMNMMMGLNCLIWRYPIRKLGMFISGHTRDSSPNQEAALEVQKTDDAGLPPLLTHVEETINQYLLWARWPKLRFEFTSKNPTEDARGFAERIKARTWGEARAETDLPPLRKVYKGKSLSKAMTESGNKINGGEDKGNGGADVDDDIDPMEILAEIMEGCPEDPVKASVYQTVAIEMVKARLGTAVAPGAGGGGAGSSPKKGPAMSNQKDPAVSQTHGNLAGVRRDSRMEKDRAEAAAGVR